MNAVVSQTIHSVLIPESVNLTRSNTRYNSSSDVVAMTFCTYSLGGRDSPTCMLGMCYDPFLCTMDNRLKWK